MVKSEVESRLKSTYGDADIGVTDLTGEGSNYEVKVASATFEGMTRIKQHQAVMSLFQNELDSGEVHALSINTRVI